MNTQSGNFRFSHAHFAGLGAFVLAITLSFFDVRLSVVPLMLFLALCFVTPFLPASNFFLPTINRGKSGKNAVAITFDDGPDPRSTPELLSLLSKYNVKATFFVTGEKVSAHPDLIKEILRYGHSLGNHSYSHDNFIMFKSTKALTKEIESAQDTFKKFGVTPFVFRPPVGITNPRLWRVLQNSGMYNVNFSCRAVDGGNRWIKDLSKRILKRLRPDDIIALHDMCPRDKARLSYWLKEVEAILSGLDQRGIAIWPLSELIGRSVMSVASEDEKTDYL
jgi:peptidoglycan/xylan/chitin deacetylase (PgdA/CDA1 family)